MVSFKFYNSFNTLECFHCVNILTLDNSYLLNKFQIISKIILNNIMKYYTVLQNYDMDLYKN